MNFDGNIVIAQSGGPTAAINATLCGAICAALDFGVNIYGARYGIDGIINNNTILLNDIFKTEENRTLLNTTPSAFLGSCRHRLPDADGKNDTYELIFDNLKNLDAKYLIYIGGNDSMDTVAKLSKYSILYNKEVIVVGIPKTIDNDLAGTDHSPGFGSAAKFVATTVKEIARDSAVYDQKSITVVEIMGRNAGWLTASSALARTSSCSAPQLIYLPEKPISKEKMIEDINNCDEQNIVIAISEGIKDENGNYYCESKAGAHDIFGHAQLAGAAGVVSDFLKNHFNYKTRGIEINVLQRCASHFASKTDIEESGKIGYAGVKAALDGKNGVVMGFLRDGEYNIKIIENEASKIANLERKMPDDYISPNFNDVTEKFFTYAKPLVMGEVELIYEDGLPKHISVDEY